MSTAIDPKNLISPDDMKIVEHVLIMGGGYVLDFSNRTFDDFIAHEIGIDASAPKYSEDGNSKAKRLRRILHSLPGAQQAKLLRALLNYKDGPNREEAVRILDDEWRKAYNEIIQRLEDQIKDAGNKFEVSAWKGRRTIREQVAIVRNLGPIAFNEVDTLASLLESKRFNDPITADAVQCLRDLHNQLGALISEIDNGNISRDAIQRIEANRQKLLHYIIEGAKLTVVAPTMTFGIMHVLAWITGVPIDTTLVSAVFGAVVGADALKSFSKNSSLAP